MAFEDSLHGAISSATLGANGVHRAARSRLVADGVLKQPVRGVFTFAGAPHTYEQDCAVALILGGPDAAIAGAAAARLHDLDGFAPRRGKPVTVGGRGQVLGERATIAGRTPSVNVPRSSGRRGDDLRRVDAIDDVCRIDGLRVIGVTQTLIELGAGLPETQSPGGHRLRSADLVELALESALHRKLTALDHIRDVLNGVGRTSAGAATLRRVLTVRPSDIAPTESWLETRTMQVLRTAGIMDLERQVEIRTPSGVRIGRVDFRRRPVIIECDGAEWHPDFEEDRKRWAALQSAGYLVLPATFQMVEFRTSEFIRTLRELTEQADRSALRRRGSG